MLWENFFQVWIYSISLAFSEYISFTILLKTGFFSCFLSTVIFWTRHQMFLWEELISVSCSRKSVKSCQTSFLIKGCDEMKNTEFTHDWFIQTYPSENFIDNTFENWFLFLFVNSLALHFVIAIAIVGRMLSRFPVCFSFYLVWFFLVKCSWKNYKIWETYYLSGMFSRKNQIPKFLRIFWTSCKSYLLLLFVIFLVKKSDWLKIRECFLVKCRKL